LDHLRIHISIYRLMMLDAELKDGQELLWMIGLSHLAVNQFGTEVLIYPNRNTNAVDKKILKA